MRKINEATINIVESINTVTMNYSLGLITRDRVLAFTHECIAFINRSMAFLPENEVLIIIQHYNVMCDWAGALDFKINIQQTMIDMHSAKFHPMEKMTIQQQQEHLNKIFIDSDKYNPEKSNYSGETFIFCVGNKIYKPQVILDNIVNPDMPYVKVPIEFLAKAASDPIKFLEEIGSIPIIEKRNI